MRLAFATVHPAITGKVLQITSRIESEVQADISDERGRLQEEATRRVGVDIGIGKRVRSFR